LGGAKMHVKNLIVFLIIISVIGISFLNYLGNGEDIGNVCQCEVGGATYKPPAISTIIAPSMQPYAWEDSFKLIVYTPNIKGVIINGDTIKWRKGGIVILMGDREKIYIGRNIKLKE